MDRPILQALDAAVRLDDDTVGVWLAPPEAVLAHVADGAALLSAAERHRHGTFLFGGDRALYLAAHVLARCVVGAAAGCPPRDIVLGAEASGRPVVLAPDRARPLQLSLSHTRGLIAVALARRLRCGVDVERLRDDVDLELLGAAICSPAELAWFRRLPPGGRREAFFGLWTIKEALLKGAGVGLAGDPATISVLPDWGRPRVLLLRSRLARVERGWRVVHGRPTPGHALALAFGDAEPIPSARARVVLWDLASGKPASKLAAAALPVVSIAQQPAQRRDAVMVQ